MGAPACAILNALPRLHGNPYVLPGKNKGEHLVVLPHIWSRFRKRSGLEWATLHILRHSFASFGAGSCLGLPVIGKLLGHKDSATTARYAKVDLDPERAAAELISLGISTALSREPQDARKAFLLEIDDNKPKGMR